MKKLNTIIRNYTGKLIYLLMPRNLRHNIVKTMVIAEENAPPQQSVKSLLQIYDYVATSIDMESIRWGNGIHIKHQLMDGIHSFFYSRIPDGSNVLDLGCGRGTVANAIAENCNAKVFGIDFNKNHIEFATQKYKNPNLQFLCGDVFSDIPENLSVDVIVLSSVLEHLVTRANFLSRLSEHFHPKIFLIRVPTLERTHYVAIKRELGISPYIDPTHEIEYSVDIFKDEMEQAGLIIKHMEIRWGDIWAECEPK